LQRSCAFLTQFTRNSVTVFEDKRCAKIDKIIKFIFHILLFLMAGNFVASTAQVPQGEIGHHKLIAAHSTCPYG
jgi:hypothetical protein